MDAAHGPIHLNVPLIEPLVAPGEHVVAATQARDRQADERRGPASRQSRFFRAGATLASLLPTGMSEGSMARGVLVAGDFDDEAARAAAATLATAMGWPIISEPSGNLSGHPHAVRHGPSVLASPRGSELVPDVVVTVGRVGLHRSVTRLLRESRAHIAVDVPPFLGRVDGAQTASVIVDAVPVTDGPAMSSDSEWLRLWAATDDVAAAAVDDQLCARVSELELSGPLVASMVARHAGEDDLLVVGPSWPVRHVSMFAGPLRSLCIGNRGTSGIDGVVSTGWGAAIAHGDGHPGGTTYVLVGDLTAIYDRNGLIVPASEPTPRLVYVVADNDGGGIFSGLEQGATEFARDFDRVFGTPHGADITALLAAPRVRTTSVSTATELASQLSQAHEGVTVIVARCASRQDESGLIRSIQSDIDARLT
jgi:2-succinyl-5-enolpyruvyl-6-hydroxy-3-cyclohexene-1-carboxylate synthase